MDVPKEDFKDVSHKVCFDVPWEECKDVARLCFKDVAKNVCKSASRKYCADVPEYDDEDDDERGAMMLKFRPLARMRVPDGAVVALHHISHADRNSSDFNCLIGEDRTTFFGC